MNAQLPSELLILLLVITLLGAVMGYCLSLIFAKRQARAAIELSQRQLAQERRAAESDLEAARNSIAQLRNSVTDVATADGTADLTGQSDDVTSQALQQADRIESLESQVATLEKKRLSLQKDFASYKANKRKELERAKAGSGSWTDTDGLPTLSRRVGGSSGYQAVSALSASRSSESMSSTFDDTLGFDLTADLDIPALAESEMPDAFDELEFDTIDGVVGSSKERG